MSFFIEAERAPLREEADGSVRVGNSRVLLEIVIQAFHDGATPEYIADQYSTLDLGDIYAVIAFYLRHQAEVDAYVAQRDRQGDEIRDKIERAQGSYAGIRARLIARRQARAEDVSHPQ